MANNKAKRIAAWVEQMLPSATFEVTYLNGEKAIITGEHEDVAQSFPYLKDLLADEYEAMLNAISESLTDHAVIGIQNIKLLEL